MNDSRTRRRSLPGLLLAACLALTGCDQDAPVPPPQAAPATGGDAPRLESLAKWYGVGTLVGQDTVAQCPAHTWRWVDCVRVVGRAQQVELYTPEISAVHDARAEAEWAVWQDYTMAYLQRDWQRAAALLQRSDEQLPPGLQRLHAIHRQRMERFLEQPPPEDWDGAMWQHEQMHVSLAYPSKYELKSII